jgi:hypothetical protein
MIDKVSVTALPSLFVISVPRSLSTLVHHQCCAALGLRSPGWTTAGEILNGERLALTGEGPGPRFTQLDEAYLREQLFEFLDAVVRPAGHCYKDVVQPFVVAQWLARRSLPALRIRRRLADVACALECTGWRYPGHPGSPDDPDATLRGLLLASRALDAAPAQVLDFDELIFREDALREALRPLYPNFAIPPIHFLDAAFAAHRDNILAQRQSARWSELDARLSRLSERLPAGGAGAPPRQEQGLPSR